PNVDELAWVGISDKSNATVVSALAPHVESGEVVLLGESSVEAWRRAVAANRILRRFVPLEVQPAGTHATREVMHAVAADARADVVVFVTLGKAGLNDPNKPLGVFLFVGPTGVGKTELARALAEHLFGDAARLIRLDMSEFATYEAFERLIGQGYRGAEPGLLTSAVRDHPFSVLLFDAIEKAHPNISNLCLQGFCAGRLTD